MASPRLWHTLQVESSDDARPPRASVQPTVVGALAGAPGAGAFATEIARLLHRYAAEVVAAFGLCPHVQDVAGSLGAVCIVLDRDLAAATAARAVRATGAKTVHVVCPLAGVDAPRFERFGNAVAHALAHDGGFRLVHATFHPELAGGTENPERLVGILRRAPDPFVQLVPPGIQQGGATIAGSPPPPPPADEPIVRTYGRLRGEPLERLVALQAELHAERRRLHERTAPPFGGATIAS